MAKTLIVGDIHLKARIMLAEVDEALAADDDISRIVFLGDVCDEWGADDGRMMRLKYGFATRIPCGRIWCR